MAPVPEYKPYKQFPTSVPRREPDTEPQHGSYWLNEVVGCVCSEYKSLCGFVFSVFESSGSAGGFFGFSYFDFTELACVCLCFGADL